MTGVSAYTIGSPELDRLLGAEVIDRLARKMIRGNQPLHEPTTRAALVGMLRLAASLSGAPGYTEIVAAVCTAAVAYTAPDRRGDTEQQNLDDALAAVVTAVQVRYCTDVKNLDVSDWIASRARDIVALTLRDAR